MLRERNSKKRILYIVEAMGGGVFTYIVDLANELIEEYDIYIAYAVRPQTPKNYKEYFDKRIKLFEVAHFERSINFVNDIKAFIEIRKIAEEVCPELIHLHSSKAGALGRWAFNGKKIPLFYTPHGYSFLMQNKSFVKRSVYRSVEAICAMRHCMTISCSEGEHNESLKLTKNATYVNNGINVTELQKILDSISVETNHPFTVFTIGRICYQKNPGLFNEIAFELPDIRFVWIGDGELREELTAPNIEITGWCEREEALRESLQGDVFILTSLWEGLPISLLEAMYMKKLCVVSNVIGNRDVIKTEKNGFVCSSVDEFVNAIERAYFSDVSGLIDEAYKNIAEQYNTNVMGRKYNALYMENIEI